MEVKLVALCVAILLITTTEGTTIYNRAKGLLKAFDAEPRDTQQTAGPHEANGYDVGLPEDQYLIFGATLNFLRCFQIGYCLGGETDPGTNTGTPPSENPSGTGMAIGANSVLLAPYVFPVNDETYTYKMAYRELNFNNDWNKHDIQRLAAEIKQASHEDPNGLDLSNWVGFVVTWNIFATAATGNVDAFQLALVSSGTDTYVIYLYGDMPIPDITGNVRGYISGGAQDKSARVCNKLTTPTNSIEADAVIAKANLIRFSNYKCGNPGVYVFKTAADDACGGTGSDCSTAYTATTSTPNCNVTAVPQDSCTESYDCKRDSTEQGLVTLNIHAKWYTHTAPYIQALIYSSWVGSGSDTAPLGVQKFVPFSSVPEEGACGKVLSTSPTTDSISIKIDLAQGSEDTCGMDVDAGSPATIKFAFKIFEWDNMGLPFGPNEDFDRPGDLIIYGICYPDDMPVSLTQTKVFNDPEQPTSMPSRTRSLAFDVVDQIHDTEAELLSEVQIGQLYYLRICFDPGTPYNKQADPFGIYVKSCDVSNNADFTDTNPDTDFVQTFISESCPINDGATTGPLYYGSNFKVRSDGLPNNYAFGDPPKPWCLYTTSINAARWNKFQAATPLDKLFFKCQVDFCVILDGPDGTEEKLCRDSCPDSQRRKRSVSNDTSIYPSEVVYTSLTLKDNEDEGEEICSDNRTDFKIAIATIVTMLALLSVAILATILVFVKLMRFTKLGEKEKQLK